MNERVKVILRKEFREYRRNKLIVGTMAGMPLFFLGYSLLTLLTIPETVNPAVVNAVAGQALLMFLLIPAILPTTIAAYAVIGEREQGTLEPLLTTPATDGEILMAKALAATGPGVVLTWVLFGIVATALSLFAAPAVRDAMLGPESFTAVGFLAPALGVFAIEFALFVSSRSTDIRVAQQLAGLALIPAVVVMSLFTFGVIEPSVGRYLLVAVVLACIDVAGWQLVTRLFDRERVLTRFGD